MSGLQNFGIKRQNEDDPTHSIETNKCSVTGVNIEESKIPNLKFQDASPVTQSLDNPPGFFANSKRMKFDNNDTPDHITSNITCKFPIKKCHTPIICLLHVPDKKICEVAALQYV